jgi:ribosomal protein S18 acetylase RimI-like enzyme
MTSEAIRPATLADQPALLVLDAAAWSPDATPAPIGSRAFFGPGIHPGDVLVAEVDWALAGYAQLSRVTPFESNAHVLELTGLAVDPALRGRRLGRRLVEAAAREAAVRGARRLRLRVLAFNVAARSVYEACGFVEEGVLRGEFLLVGRYVDDVLMARDLSPTAG